MAIRFTGDASILAHCLRAAIAKGGAADVIEENAFKAACCRRYDRSNATDAAHMAAAWAIVEPQRLGTFETDTGGKSVEVCVLPDGTLAIVTGLPR